MLCLSIDKRHLGSGTPPGVSCTGDSTDYRIQKLMGEARATELLRQPPFQAPDSWPLSQPEDRDLPGAGALCLSIGSRHLSSGTLPSVPCTDIMVPPPHRVYPAQLQRIPDGERQM